MQIRLMTVNVHEGPVLCLSTHINFHHVFKMSALRMFSVVTLTFDFLTLKVVSESRVTWATSVQILVSLGLSYASILRCSMLSQKVYPHN